MLYILLYTQHEKIIPQWLALSAGHGTGNMLGVFTDIKFMWSAMNLRGRSRQKNDPPEVIPGLVDVPLFGERVYVSVIKPRILQSGDIPGFSGWAPNPGRRALIRETHADRTGRGHVTRAAD